MARCGATKPPWRSVRARLDWDGEVLTIRIDEVTAPIPSRLRGTVRIRPAGINRRRFTLDAAGRHRWQPIAAASRAEVVLESPGLRWSGPAYFDTNDGDAPLEADFIDWDWCRAPLREGAAILYNARRRDGTRQSLALRVDADGQLTEFTPPPPASLPRTRWGIGRPTGADAGTFPGRDANSGGCALLQPFGAGDASAGATGDGGA